MFLTTELRRLAFQSTHSITECDADCKAGLGQLHHFNPRTPLQSATKTIRRMIGASEISIHALHYRVRPGQCPTLLRGGWHFNPRTPLQSATFCVGFRCKIAVISIHALHYRVRRSSCNSAFFAQCNFNPRTPLQSAT